MTPIDEPTSFEPPSPEAAERRAKPKPAAEPPAAPGDLVAFTINTANGRIEKVEGVDASGARRELTIEEKARLRARAAEVTLEGVVERAFEAGIECLLGADGADGIDEEADTPSEEAGLMRRLILRSLMADTPAQRLMQREVLGRAIAGTLIVQAVGAESSLAH
jgi:hypothetical protein